MLLSNVILFFTTAIVMICTPGPDIIYVSTRGIAQGRNIALLSTIGVCIGYTKSDLQNTLINKSLKVA